MATNFWSALGFKPGTEQDAQNWDKVKAAASDALSQMVPFRSPGAPPARPAVDTTDPNAMARFTPQPAARPSVSANENVQSGSLASSAQPTPPQPFRATLRGGVQYTADDQGNRTYTMGTPGTDGSATATVSPRQWGRTAVVSPRAVLTQQQPVYVPAAGPPRAVLTQQQPVYVPAAGPPDKTPLEISMENSDRMKGPANTVPGGVPQYLGPESGLGWKTRLGIYKEQMDAYDRQTGNQTAFDIARMRDIGAGQQALLAAQSANARTLVEQELGTERNRIAALTGEAAIAESASKVENSMRVAAAADALSKLKPGTPEYTNAQNYLFSISGQGSAIPRPKVLDPVKLSSVDAMGNRTERLVQPNATGYTELQDNSPRAKALAAFSAKYGGDKAIMDKFSSLSKERQDIELAKFLAEQDKE